MQQLHNLNPQHFLTHYWQKRPVVIKQAFDRFQDPLDENELAGLAMEPDVDARIVSLQGQNWQLHQGPFDDFSPLCQGEWTLLVQGVDSYVHPVQQLMYAFNFLPAWRKEDVMVSYSVPGAGVGPHLDQYDVFIIQGKGSRRWQVGDKGEFDEWQPTPGLRQIQAFNPIIDEVLHPGDMIYIPPGFPHNGTACEHCLNYSVGFRAPTQSALLSAFADFVLDQVKADLRYQDPDLELRVSPFAVTQKEQARFKGMLHQLIDSSLFNDWLGAYLSTDEPLSATDDELENLSATYTVEEIDTLLRQGACFLRTPDIKCAFLEPVVQTQLLTVYLNGIPFQIPSDQIPVLNTLLALPCWPAADGMTDDEELEENVKLISKNSLFFNQFFTKLVNSGLWYPEE